MKAYYLHMAIPRILLTKTETLIGYQYRNNAYNRDISEDIWFANERPPTEKELKTFKVLPKRLSEPLTNYLNFIDNHENH